MIDCMNLYPNNYLLYRDLCCEEFHAQNFPQNELQQKSSAISNYLKLAFYPYLKQAIETNSVEEIKAINHDMTKMGYHLKDLNPNSYLNDYIRGERYIPLLFLALEHRAIASIQCLTELGVPLIGQIYKLKSDMNEHSRWISVRSRAEELECFDIIDIINDLEDDNELKDIFKPRPAPIETISNENSVKAESQIDMNSEELPKQQNIMKTLFGKNQQNTKSQTCVIF